MVRRMVSMAALAAAIGGCQSVAATRPGSPSAAPATAAAQTTAPTANPHPAASAIPANATIVLPPLDTRAQDIPPEMLDALVHMTDEDFKSREDAVARLQHAMVRQFQQMVQIQDVLLHAQQALGNELNAVSAGPTDPNIRAAGLMEFNSAVSRWAVDVLAMDNPQRDDFLQWGMKEENMPLVARAYARQNSVRAKASRDLAKLAGPEVDWLLVQLLNDDSREVELTALDAVAARAPTKAITDVLWDHAVSLALNQFSNRPQQAKNITIHGRTITIYDPDPNQNSYRQQDADVVVDVLIAMKSDDIRDRLNKMFTELSGRVNSNDGSWRVISPNYGEGGRAISRLMDAYKPKDAIPFLMKVVNMENNDGYDQQINNDKVRYSTRIDAAAMLIKAVGQDPGDYGIRKYQQYGDRWMLKGSVPEENAMAKRLQDWWRIHQNDPTAPGPTPAATAPAPAGTTPPRPGVRATPPADVTPE